MALICSAVLHFSVVFTLTVIMPLLACETLLLLFTDEVVNLFWSLARVKDGASVLVVCLLQMWDNFSCCLSLLLVYYLLLLQIRKIRNSFFCDVFFFLEKIPIFSGKYRYLLLKTFSDVSNNAISFSSVPSTQQTDVLFSLLFTQQMVLLP